jgi:hypothetical protein
MALGPILLLLFYWVPFALAAYLIEIWDPERTRRSLRELRDRIRHIHPHRPAATGA